MSSEHVLAEFQRAAVDHIVARLRDRRGSRRFLLADEVGLGKTIVARGVIDELAARRSTLKVVYLCSNSEIAEQNRSKLVVGGGTSIGRATELALLRNGAKVKVDMYAFTPGTSLAGGTGRQWERRLMLFLLQHVFHVEVDSPRWREYFRCGAGQERWNDSSKWSALRGEFLGRTATPFQVELRRQASSIKVDDESLIDAIAGHVSTFSKERIDERRRRNALIGRFRGLLQRVALRQLQPDLLVLDEVQRFKEVIDKATDDTEIAYELFRAGKPVLILSATPYRLLTLEHESRAMGSRHYDDFFRTLEFLYADDTTTPARVRKNLEAFGVRLAHVPLNHVRDEELLELKREIEGDLRQVICRTERNWFFLDSRRGVAEHGAKRQQLPAQAELREFMHIHRGLGSHLEDVGQVTEFWKSAPSLLTFMDRSYALTRKLQAKSIRVPRALVERANHPQLPERNLRVRRLVEHSLGEPTQHPLLWTRPTYTYHEDRVFRGTTARKMLVFSGWRFVPKAIAILVSDAAAARTGKSRDDGRQPLRFTSKGSLHVFDTCMPSWALSEVVDPFAIARAAGGTIPTTEEVLREALAQLEKHLSTIRVSISSTRADPLWRVVARMEQHTKERRTLATALAGWTDSDMPGGPATELRDSMLEWLHDGNTALRLGRADLYRLALIAVASPAVCLQRSLRATYGDEDVARAMVPLLERCLGSLRSYFNRPLVQRVVRRHTSKFRWRRKRIGVKRSYSEGLLSYALDHHLQAVLDEHTHLLRHASGNATATDALHHFRQIWSLGSGMRRTNRGSGRGENTKIGTDSDTWPTHFALAFGEDVAAEGMPLDERESRMRRSEIREAFNSPFWPFVLATTSVGQEGLDFHLHCRDVFHWNLPSNPVDLEQREGRINRRDCLAVRQSIARDLPMPAVLGLGRQNGGQMNPWSAVFGHLERVSTGGSSKHGLHPHWIYECREGEHTVPIERHVAFFEASRDSQQYERLKSGLALYRLVFGQVNQEHLLNDLEKRLEALPAHDRDAARRRLSGYMLNLSPIDSRVALRYSEEEAERMLAGGDSSALAKLLDEVTRIAERHAQELTPAMSVIEALTIELRTALREGRLKTRRLRKVVAALAYLRNPYDQYFDGQSIGGFDDDIVVLKRALGGGSRKTG